MKMKKIKSFINYQKEERWINEMAAKGWYLIDYKFLRYTFEKGEPGKCDYCIELLSDLPSTEEGEKHLEFMEESGIEHVAQYFSWAYFRKEATGEPFEIYTDYDSRKRHLTRIITSLSIVMFLNLVLGVFNAVISSVSLLKVNIYGAIVNGIIVMITTPLIIGYFKNILDLKRDR